MMRDPSKVAILAYDQLCTFEFGIMVELFCQRPEFPDWYTVQVCVEGPKRVRAAGGIVVEVPYRLGALDRAGTIVIPGWRRPLDEVTPALIRKLRRAHDEGARLLSVCSGAFVLAATGLLDGCRATTHWLYAAELAEAHPQLEVDPDVLYVDAGQILTSAGSAAGIDMGLHLIRRDHGARIANTVARRLVVPPHRDGGQLQFIASPVEREADEGELARLLDSVRANLRRPHTVESMAQRAKMSSRTFARRFKEATGTTPHRWLVRERVHLAQTLLEMNKWNIDQVAERSGFGEAQLLRLHFKRVVGTSPTEYRRSFRSDSA
jgi:AraC family transcriptional activator FtrA